jgi:hypothetical protein
MRAERAGRTGKAMAVIRAAKERLKRDAVRADTSPRNRGEEGRGGEMNDETESQTVGRDTPAEPASTDGVGSGRVARELDEHASSSAGRVRDVASPLAVGARAAFLRRVNGGMTAGQRVH